MSTGGMHYNDFCLTEKCSCNPKEASKIIKEITRTWKPQTEVINSKSGTTLTETEAILKRWADYCEELYKEQQPQDQPWKPTREESPEPEPTREEVTIALKQLKNGKSSGVDDIPAELWKMSGKEGVTLIWKLCIAIWKRREWPKEWCTGVFVPLPKKGNLKECSNYRTINLIVHASKVLLKIIAARTRERYQREIREEQAGFMKERGTREQITNIRIIMDKHRECSAPLYMCFIDYSKAFDCVNHHRLWTDMENMGFPVHIISLLDHLYREQLATVRTTNGSSSLFPIGRGVRQGCILSPSLFNIYTEEIIREAI